MPNDQKRLLIAGGAYADIPMILAAKKQGYYVITSGNRAEDLGHSYSDQYAPGDFSDREQMLSLAKQLKIDAVCASCNDFSALSSAYIAESLNLPGHDSLKTAEIIHHKDQFREFCKANQIPIPADAKGFTDLEQAAEWIKKMARKVIVKPIDLTGGKGVSTLNQGEDPHPALEKAFAISKAKRIVVEEFIEGTRHGFSSFLENGKVVFYFSDNEHYYLNPYLVSAASTPSTVPESAEKALCEISEKISKILNLRSGIFHVQYILSGQKPVIIEICRRPPGDLYVKLVEHATGIDYPGYIIKAATGRLDGTLHHQKPRGAYIRHCIMGSRLGKTLSIRVDDSVKSKIIDQFLWWKPGMENRDIMTTKYGIVFLKFENQGELLETADRLPELIRVEME